MTVKPETTWKRIPVGAMLGAEVVVRRASLSGDEILFSMVSQRAIRHARTVQDPEQPDDSQHR